MSNLSWDEREEGPLPDNYFDRGVWGTPQFHKLELINFTSVIHIPLVESLRLLRVLELKHCTNAISIPSLPNLEELTIKWCTQISDLPDFPKITRLIVNDCNRLDLKNFRSTTLLTLDCKDCRNISSLPPKEESAGVPSLTHLDCSSTDVRIIPDYPQLLVLECNNLLSLSSLPNCPNLEKIECRDCINIDHIQDQFPELRELDCSRCERIEQLPYFPHLSILLCRELFRLVKIPIYPNLEELDCSWCILLSEIPGYPLALKVLNCIGCTSLTELPPCYNVTDLDCSKCIQITFIPDECTSLEYLKCNETGVECLSEFFYDKQPADGIVQRCFSEEDGSGSSSSEEDSSSGEEDSEEEFESDEWIDREREQRLEVYRNGMGGGSQDHLRSIAYGQPVRNTIQDWDRDIALLTSRGLYTEEDGRLINFQDDEDQENQDYLDQNRNNLIFMFPWGNDNNKYKAFGYTLDQIFTDPFINVIYECMKDQDGNYIINQERDEGHIPRTLVDQPKAYIKISLDVQAYVPAEELLGAIESGERVFLLHHPTQIDRTYSLGAFVSRNNFSDSHCQRGTDKMIYSLRVCASEPTTSMTDSVLGKRIR